MQLLLPRNLAFVTNTMYSNVIYYLSDHLWARWAFISLAAH